MADLVTTREHVPSQMARSAVLLLADGRLPAGGHAHSGGLEAAAALEGVRDLRSLEQFLRGRAATAGSVAAAFAAAGCAALARSKAGDVSSLIQLDRELDARIPSPTLRAVSRRLGRNMLRAGRAIWPHPGLDNLAAFLDRSPHHPVALGAVAGAAGLSPIDVAAAALHDAVAGPATAAVRLLGLDPLSVHAILGKIGPELDALAADAAAMCHRPAWELPAFSSPLLDVLAEAHATWEVRLFAS
jgi:urease accessory protein